LRLEGEEISRGVDSEFSDRNEYVCCQQRDFIVVRRLMPSTRSFMTWKTGRGRGYSSTDHTVDLKPI